MGPGQADARLPTTVPEDVPPNVTVFVPPRDGFSNTGNGPRTSKLLCQATGFSPKQISVSWLRDGKQVDSGVTTDKVEAEPKESGPLTYRVTSSLVITEIQWLSQSVFTCHVEHGNESFKKNVSSVCGIGERSLLPSRTAPDAQAPAWACTRCPDEPAAPGAAVARGGREQGGGRQGGAARGPSTPAPAFTAGRCPDTLFRLQVRPVASESSPSRPPSPASSSPRQQRCPV